MPFQMTHLHIAKKVQEYFPSIVTDIPQFYLGAVAPDAIHNRADYVSDFKKTSHLCVGDEKWGQITNNDEWIHNVLEFMCKNKESVNYNFIIGYCCHVLSDIHNNRTVWHEFKRKYSNELSKGYGGLYHQESEKVEIELALRDENKDNFWIHLEEAKPICLYDMVNEDEVAMHKENILYNWFKDKECQDISSNELVTLEGTMDFINDAARFIITKIEDIV